MKRQMVTTMYNKSHVWPGIHVLLRPRFAILDFSWLALSGNFVLLIQPGNVYILTTAVL